VAAHVISYRPGANIPIMGVVEEVHQALQDIVAPELREIKTRLDGLEKRIDSVDRRIDGLGQQLREELRGMRDEILTATRSHQAQVQDLRDRVIRLEDRQTH